MTNSEDKLYHYRAKVVEVYDGDTVTAIVDLGFHIQMEMKIRLVGINAPEMQEPTKAKGTTARNYLRKVALNKSVTLQTMKDKQEKYGRYLGTLWLDGETTSINETLIAKGYAVPYME